MLIMMVRINTILLAALSILAPAVQASPSSEVSFLGHRATTPIEETADFEDLQVTGFSAQELGEYKNAKFIGLSKYTWSQPTGCLVFENHSLTLLALPPKVWRHQSSPRALSA